MRYFIIHLLLAIPSFGVHSQVLFQDENGSRIPRAYDVIHYKLNLGFDEAQKQVSGTALITLTPLRERLDSAVFDAIEMDVRSVGMSSGIPVSHRSDSASLTLTFDTPVQVFDTVTVSIDYSCTPQQGLHFIQPDSSDQTRRWQIWTQGEESDNRHWFPCYDAPDDKATSEVIATVRDSYVVLSNGSLVAETWDLASGTRTFHWRQEKPHSSYLIMLAAGEYTIIREEAGGVPISHYIPVGDREKGRLSFQNTREILESIEKVINYPYPWEKYSQIVLENFMWGGMENTSAVTLNEAYLYDRRAALDFSADPVIAHEVAHQWWGDLVTCRDWSHLWLHEGFANYYEALYKRSAYGFDEYQYEARQWAKSIRNLDETAGRKPIVSNESFSVNLYQRGAWVLRMLSKILGEQSLLEALTRYAHRHEFGTVATEDLISALEEFTGKDLRWFFDQWVYGAGYPALDVTTDWNDDNGMFRLTVTQVQPTDSLTGLFKFPVEIELTTASGRHLNEIWISKQEETFVLPLDERPLMVIVDRGLNALMSLNQDKTKTDYLYQLANASEGIDRLEACDGLSAYMDDREVFEALTRSAHDDSFWAVRVKAVNSLADMDIDEEMEVFSGFYFDDDSRVRAAAIVALGKFETPETAAFLERAAAEDSSYVVLSSCIRTLVQVDSSRGFDLAASSVEMDSYRDMIRAASLNALRRLNDIRSVPIALTYVAPPYETSTRVIAIGILADIGHGSSEAKGTLTSLAGDPNASIRLAAIRGLGSWGGTENESILRERITRESNPDVLKAIEKALSGEKDN